MVVVNMRSTPRFSLVTGGTDGIGRAVALQLAAGGDRVLFVGRDAERGAEVLSALRAARPGVQHVFLQADLSLLSEAARVADEVEHLTDRLDAAIFCAGVLALRPEWTREGLERTFVLNYLSRYLLATRLVPALTLAPAGRLVLVANAAATPTRSISAICNCGAPSRACTYPAERSSPTTCSRSNSPSGYARRAYG